MHVCLLPTHVAAGPLEQSSRPDAAHGPQIPTLTKKGSFLLQGWWQRRKCSSPEQWARSAVWQCSSADLWDVKSSKWSHPTQCQKNWQIASMLPHILVSLNQQALHGVVPHSSVPWNFTSIPLKFPFHQYELDILWKRSHTGSHTCRDFSTAAHYSSPLVWVGIFTPRMYLLWLSSLWGEGSKIVCLVYTNHFPRGNGQIPACRWLSFIELAMLLKFSIHLLGL